MEEKALVGRHESWRCWRGVSSLTTTLLEEVQVHYWKKCQFTITVAKAMVVSALDDVDLEPE
jgi:hypothetical protein